MDVAQSSYNIAYNILVTIKVSIEMKWYDLEVRGQCHNT